MTEITDEQCNEFRRLPCSFNDMVRAIYKAGWQAGVVEAIKTGIEVREQYDKEIGNGRVRQRVKRSPV